MKFFWSRAVIFLQKIENNLVREVWKMKKIFKKIIEYYRLSKNNTLFDCFPTDITEEELEEVRKILSQCKK